MRQNGLTELVLLEWPDGRLAGSARFLGRLFDADLVAEARRRLVEAQRARLDALEGEER